MRQKMDELIDSLPEGPKKEACVKIRNNIEMAYFFGPTK
jgi:hypothetical protein